MPEVYIPESPMPTIYFPSDEKLESVLSTILVDIGPGAGVRERKRVRDAGFFSSEVVTYRLGPGKETQLFCKYSSDSGHLSFGHRGGGSYEAAVYGMLDSLDSTCPKLHGTFVEPETARVWLVLEYVPSLQVNETPDPVVGLRSAACWIGDLHRRAGDRLTREQTASLNIYDLDYYRAWADRTAAFAGDLHTRFPWLQGVCDGFAAEAGEWLIADRVLVHGEYYPMNVLIDRSRVCPVDWETAALGAGEIDLAALVEGWPSDIATECEEEYRRARGAEVDDESRHRLDAARLYLTFRWLGDRPEWTQDPDLLPRFDVLRALGTKLGLI